MCGSVERSHSGVSFAALEGSRTSRQGTRLLVFVVLALLSGGVEADGVCDNTCEYASNGDCDDGGPNSDYVDCSLGSDCDDCGERSFGDSYDGDNECPSMIRVPLFWHDD